jgi:hypothetical protein
MDEPRHLREALRLMERTRQLYPYDGVVSHRLSLDQVNEALRPRTAAMSPAPAWCHRAVPVGASGQADLGGVSPRWS